MPGFKLGQCGRSSTDLHRSCTSGVFGATLAHFAPREDLHFMQIRLQGQYPVHPPAEANEGRTWGAEMLKSVKPSDE